LNRPNGKMCCLVNILLIKERHFELDCGLF
jgi:hypothetical protein